MKATADTTPPSNAAEHHAQGQSTAHPPTQHLAANPKTQASTPPQAITLRAADDCHYHFREDAALQRTVPDAAQQFERVIAMPNTTQPIVSIKQARAYRKAILQHVPTGLSLQPLMTLYLQTAMSQHTLRQAAAEDIVHALKLYPAGATTGSRSGPRDLNALYPLLEQLQNLRLPLLVHAEVTDPEVDCFEREIVFIERYLQHWVRDFPELKIVVEHVTSAETIQFVQSCKSQWVGATITPHHLWCNRNHLLAQSLRPDYYCLPILKHAQDQQALIQAAISGDPHFFLGSDGAPHTLDKKYNACGCAGIYHGTHTLELYAQLFAQHNALQHLEAFCSIHGAKFYGLPLNQQYITLQPHTHNLTELLPYASGSVKPLFAGKAWHWKLQTTASHAPAKKTSTITTPNHTETNI